MIPIFLVRTWNVHRHFREKLIVKVIEKVKVIVKVIVICKVIQPCSWHLLHFWVGVIFLHSSSYKPPFIYYSSTEQNWNSLWWYNNGCKLNLHAFSRKSEQFVLTWYWDIWIYAGMGCFHSGILGKGTRRIRLITKNSVQSKLLHWWHQVY